jgi:hypothetical protein
MTTPLETCQLCALRTEALSNRHGAYVCRSCMTLFWFAEVLLEAEATEEEIVPTLAFARYAENLWDIHDSERRIATVRRLAAEYPAFDLAKVVDGVPVLKMKHALAEVTRYENSNLPKGVRIRVLSRFADPDALAKLYWDVCEREALPIHQTSPGSMSWVFDQMHLVVEIGPREEIAPSRVQTFSRYPRLRRFAFPLDGLVGELLSALLGEGQEKNQRFAALLSDLGRHTPMSPKRAVTACVLWEVRGERNPYRVQRSEEVAELISRLLLEPLDKERITVSRNDPVWRDAKKVSHRFDLCKYLLQETHSRDKLFEKHVSTPP